MIFPPIRFRPFDGYTRIEKPVKKRRHPRLVRARLKLCEHIPTSTTLIEPDTSLDTVFAGTRLGILGSETSCQWKAGLPSVRYESF